MALYLYQILQLLLKNPNRKSQEQEGFCVFYKQNSLADISLQDQNACFIVAQALCSKTDSRRGLISYAVAMKCTLLHLPWMKYRKKLISAAIAVLIRPLLQCHAQTAAGNFNQIRKILENIHALTEIWQLLLSKRPASFVSKEANILVSSKSSSFFVITHANSPL